MFLRQKCSLETTHDEWEEFYCRCTFFPEGVFFGIPGYGNVAFFALRAIVRITTGGVFLTGDERLREKMPVNERRDLSAYFDWIIKVIADPLVVGGNQECGILKVSLLLQKGHHTFGIGIV